MKLSFAASAQRTRNQIISCCGEKCMCCRGGVIRRTVYEVICVWTRELILALKGYLW